MTQCNIKLTEQQTDLSGTRGAKQLVVVITHTMFSAPTRSMAALIASMSVRSSSPSSLFSSTTGSRPYIQRPTALLQQIMLQDLIARLLRK